MSNINLISFIIPAYNAERTISQPLNSLLTQTDKDFEIIIVNDGSTDRTVEIAEEILVKSNFTNYKIINKEHGGVSSARNRGIEEASGEYLVFLDADDYVSPELVQEIKKVLNKKGKVDIICWKFSMVNENGENVDVEDFIRFFGRGYLKKKKENLDFNFFFYGINDGEIKKGIEVFKKILIEQSFIIWTASAAYLKKLVTKSGIYYNEETHFGEDAEFIFKILMKSKKVVFIDKVLSFYVYPNEIRGDLYIAYKNVSEFFRKFLPSSHQIELCSQIIDAELVFSFLPLFFTFHTTLGEPSFKKLVLYINEKYPGRFYEILPRVKSLKGIVRRYGFKSMIYFFLFRISPKMCLFIHKFYKKFLNILFYKRK